MTKNYNVIMILLDGARFDSLKKLSQFNTWAEKGTLFSKMITYGPQTVTALHSLFSGINGNITGANNYFGSINFKKDKLKTLPQYLKDKNYITSADVLQDIVLPKQGFDNLTLHDELNDDIVVKHTELIKKNAKLRDENKNFFLFLQYSSIHSNVIQNVIKKYDFDDFNDEYFNNKEKNLKNYEETIKKSGKYLSRIKETCTDLNLFDDTIFIIFSDHGASVGEKPGELGYGRFCYDYTIRSFVLFIQPEIFPSKEVNKLSRIIDIAPTILDVLDIAESPSFLKIQGKSLVPLIYDESDERFALSEAAGVEKKPSNTPPKVRSIRTKDWKMILNIDSGKKELYNLKNDPDEEENLIGKFPKKEKELVEKFKELDIKT